MLGSAAGKSAPIDQHVLSARPNRGGINRKIWLPRLIYDALPWFYLASGVLAILATVYINDWYWVVPHSILFSAACLHLAIWVFRNRRHSEVDTGPVDAGDKTSP